MQFFEPITGLNAHDTPPRRICLNAEDLVELECAEKRAAVVDECLRHRDHRADGAHGRRKSDWIADDRLHIGIADRFDIDRRPGLVAEPPVVIGVPLVFEQPLKRPRRLSRPVGLHAGCFVSRRPPKRGPAPRHDSGERKCRALQHAPSGGDPQVERDRYRQQVMETKGQNLDEAGRTFLEEDLRSPCAEEIAVFQALSRVMRESKETFVIVDTAPTGHTLLLLDATGAYHRDVVHNMQLGSHVVTPMMRLQDPKQTKMVIVTLPETTPVLEAESLQVDLRRAGIEPWAWVINSSLSAASPTDPLLVARAAEEQQYVERVQKSVSRVAIIP